MLNFLLKMGGILVAYLKNKNPLFNYGGIFFNIFFKKIWNLKKNLYLCRVIIHKPFKN